MSKSIPTAFNCFRSSNGFVHPGDAPGGPSLTRQEFAEECDINTIMSNYDAYLADPMRGMRAPFYFDCSEMPDNLMDTMQLLADAREAFMHLPAGVRREFDNDPAMFVDFASDPANLGQMREWGLAPPEPVKAAPPAPAPAAGAPEPSGGGSSGSPAPASPAAS